MTTLKEQRLVSAHQLGRRDYLDGKPLVIPAYFDDVEERAAYTAGYYGERRRVERRLAEHHRNADRIDGYDRDDLGESPDF